MDDTAAGAAERVLEVARGVLADLDLEVVLQRVLVAARELTGARYAAWGVLDEDQSGSSGSSPRGMDEATRRSDRPAAGRAAACSASSSATPAAAARETSAPTRTPTASRWGIRRWRSFLGVPVLIDGAPYGNLYLTEKGGGAPFEEADEHAVVVLAELAAVAIGHARRYAGVEADRAALRRTVDALDATLQIGTALAGRPTSTRSSSSWPSGGPRPRPGTGARHRAPPRRRPHRSPRSPARCRASSSGRSSTRRGAWRAAPCARSPRSGWRTSPTARASSATGWAGSASTCRRV